MHNSDQIDNCVDEVSKAASDEARARMEQIVEAASLDGAMSERSPEFGIPIIFLPVKVSKEQYELLHDAYEAHSFHDAFHQHMFVEFGEHQEFLILRNAAPEIAEAAEQANCTGVKIYC